jgi:hypothetical protein
MKKNLTILLIILIDFENVVKAQTITSANYAFNKDASLFIDLKILFKTILIVFKGKHSDAIFPITSNNKECKTLNNPLSSGNLTN